LPKLRRLKPGGPVIMPHRVQNVNCHFRKYLKWR